MDFRSRILIVDDDIVVLEQLERVLSDDYVVSLSTSGTQALSYLRSDHWVDLILLDIMMPGQSGFEALDAIRNLPRHKKTPVIFLTSLNDTESEIKGLEQASDYITKPYKPQILKSRIERALRTAGCLDAKKLGEVPQPLSETEYYAAVLIARGYTNEEMAELLHYTTGSVRNLLVRVMNKLAINNRKEIEQYKK